MYDVAMGDSRVPRVARRASRRLLAILVVLAAGTVITSPLGAHTDVFEYAPIPGEPIGGTVDSINISYWANVLSSTILLTGPDGERIEVSSTQLSSGDRIASTTFPELTEPGRYIVDHGELSLDGDFQTAQWFFFFEPESDNRFVPLVSGGSGPNWILLLGISGVVLIVAGILWPKRAKAAA